MILQFSLSNFQQKYILCTAGHYCVLYMYLHVYPPQTKESQLPGSLWGFLLILSILCFPLSGEYGQLCLLTLLSKYNLIKRVKWRRAQQEFFFSVSLFSQHYHWGSRVAVCLKWTAWQAHNGLWKTRLVTLFFSYTWMLHRQTTALWNCKTVPMVRH